MEIMLTKVDHVYRLWEEGTVSEMEGLGLVLLNIL